MKWFTGIVCKKLGKHAHAALVVKISAPGLSWSHGNSLPARAPLKSFSGMPMTLGLKTTGPQP